ncbi:bifunctional serine/threonine-protein kinase/formylglycine-generating enzyme family protein [Hyalangium versicolor]|uniref:bifunctional serine/threonine-protein kinase/formylglycine-generating enzyme family protein n=1 Tax=Hyalangium versicolor TaxID=2861190 RepID=UPI001CC9C433|nr:bifunctional serine/threonine-protein kinase/formylglycine-generating enzyme family protein [Hyalangium versicolor]
MPSSAAPDESHCLSDELLARLIEGQLEPEERARAHRHAAECPNCHEFLVTVVAGELSQEAHSASPPEPPSAGWRPPEEFDEFRLVRPLGRGAMGVVYLAHDRSLDRHVAVKFIATHQPHTRDRERLQTEARAIARLQHPNVVTVFRIGEVGGLPYIVSEYLVGHSLAELALPVPWRRALGLGIGLARGLAAAHREGVLHRDLKPDNVLLTAAGEVKLLDFGLAELLDASTNADPRNVRTAAGTPRYMAPELFRGISATPRSDLYALGLILYELCTGMLPPRPRPDQPPVEGEPLPSGLAEGSELAHSPPLTERVPGIDPDFASLIERCLRVEPDERFASAETLRTELERIEPLHEPEVLPEGNPYRGLAPFEAEHRALFFGRDSDIRAVIERLRRQPLVLVAGDSGVGKSSLCRAGLLPRIAQGALDGYRDFSTLTLEPGRRPLAALAAALAPVLGQSEAELGDRLAGTPQWLGPTLRAVYQGGRGLVLFVDQLEELVTLSEPAQAARFATLLGELALPAEGVRVLLAVRGDFLTRVGALAGLGDPVERALYLLRPLSPEGVREAIVGPARSRGVVFESEGLLQTLVEAMASGAGSLPLLQFALAELWERRDPARGCITRAALEAMGGVAGALSRHADGVLSRLEPSAQHAARALLGRLITAEGTRIQRSEEELLTGSEQARAALRALVEGRLLHSRTLGSRTSYEIAHEALITSWSTLRQWLDEDAGQRALRQRIEASGSEWARLGHAEELLWRGRQLDEARALDKASLGTREQAFLEASQRSVRRQSLRRGLAALLLVLAVGSTYGALRLWESWKTKRFVETQLSEARIAFDQGRALSRNASASREKALALFNGQEVPRSDKSLTPGELWARAEATWDQALNELAQADAHYARGEGALDDALERIHEHAEVRRLLIELIYERIRLAEQFHRTAERTRLIQRFERLTLRDTEWQGRLDIPAELELVTDPPGARVGLVRYEEDDKGVRRPKPMPDPGVRVTNPFARVALPAGSYLLHFTKEGQAPVDLPLLLERGQHERIRLALPAARQVPEGYVYVPPGCFLAGSADPEELREFLLSAPLHTQCLQEGYLIGQSEVTLGDWVEYLDTLPEQSPQRQILATLPGTVGSALRLWKEPDGLWSFSLRLEKSGKVLTAPAGRPVHYPGRSHRSDQDWLRFPLAGVSAEDLKGYFEWLDRSGRLPGARLCREHEWTRAARGADDRRYPHGNQLEKDDANIDLTYGPEPDNRGPDMVGAHPASASPFGLLDMAGNVFELTEPAVPDIGDVVLRGGAWYYGSVGTLVANRQAFQSTFRDARVGVRLCASLPLPQKPSGGTP